MPVISMFYGVIVLMYYFDNRQHHLPHIPFSTGMKKPSFPHPTGKLLKAH
jgi:hypothetical protein